MKIKKADVIELYEKYMQVCEIMGNQKDFRLFAKLVNSTKQNGNVFNENRKKKKIPSKQEFDLLTSEEDCDLTHFMIDDRIIENKDDLAGYWERITEIDRTSFTIFNLNVIRYFISNQYKEYTEEKKSVLVSCINRIVRNKRMENKKIIV